MATAQLIDLSNYSTMLVQSTDGRAGSPDGNVYFNKVTGLMEFITVQELASVDLGSGLEANPLDETLGIRFEAAYAFENQERRVDEDLRKYDRWTDASFKFAGAYAFVNSRKPSTAADRNILRSSGWTEFATDGGVDRIYFGDKGLSNIEATSQPYYQLSVGSSPVNFAKLGQFDEAVQVFGSTANTPSDATAGDFDTRTYQAVSIRTFGQNYDRKETTTDLGIAELGPYSTGFAVNETAHLTTGAFALADVYGGTQIAPWTGMTLEKLAAPQTETGFNEADGDFTWVLNNTASGTLNECVAFLDALAQTDDDIDTGAITITNGKRVETWYSYNGAGQIVTQSGADALGLFIENIPTADEQRIVFIDDAAASKTRPFNVQNEVTVGAGAVADTNAWYHAHYLSAFNTAGAVTVVDALAASVKGNVLADHNVNRIIWAHDYDGDTVGGTAGTDKDVVFQCEGDGGVAQAKTIFTMSRTAIITASCVPPTETNV